MRFDDFLCMRSYHDGFKELDPVMLFDLSDNPHEQHDLAGDRPEVVDRAMGYLAEWEHEMALRSRHDVDPMLTVLREGGPYHVRGDLQRYVERLRATRREHHADRLLARHAGE